jgi:long-chain fatty acid transport protein
VLNGASASFAGTSIAHTEDPVSAVFGNPATLSQYFGGTHFMFGATFYQPRVQMKHDGSAGYATSEFVTGVDVPNGAAGATNAATSIASYEFDARSGADIYAVPQVAVTQDLSGLGIPVVLGVGVTATNGIGVDYKHVANSLGAAAELINLGVNAGIGMKLSDTLDVGVAMTITYAMLEAGLTGSGGMTHDIGFRGTLGARKHMGPMTVGVYYQTELEHQYDNLHVTSNDGSRPTITQAALQSNSGTPQGVICNGKETFPAGYALTEGVCRQDVEIQQPWNLGLGVSMDMGNGLLVMADVTHKHWSDAKFFNEFYDDQNVISVGVQKTMGNMHLRAGYGYADDPLLSRVKPGVHIATIGGVNAAGNAYTSPMYGLFMSYFQAMETPVIYKHRISVGLGVDSFLGVPFLSLDAHAAVQLEEDKCFGSGQGTGTEGMYGTLTRGQSLRTTVGLGGNAISGCATSDHSKATVSSFHMGGALTWSF